MTTNNAFKRNLLGAAAFRFVPGLFSSRPESLSPARKVHKKTTRSKVAKKYTPQTRQRTYAPFDKHEQTVNSMNNWQRTQWARAKKPRKDGKPKGYIVSRAKEFADLKRPVRI